MAPVTTAEPVAPSPVPVTSSVLPPLPAETQLEQQGIAHGSGPCYPGARLARVGPTLLASAWLSFPWLVGGVSQRIEDLCLLSLVCILKCICNKYVSKGQQSYGNGGPSSWLPLPCESWYPESGFEHHFAREQN